MADSHEVVGYAVREGIRIQGIVATLLRIPFELGEDPWRSLRENVSGANGAFYGAQGSGPVSLR
jgi:hypothetical protein